MSNRFSSTYANRGGFAMPVLGRDFGLSACTIQGIDVPVGGGHVAALVAGTPKGTPVWRPPSC